MLEVGLCIFYLFNSYVLYRIGRKLQITKSYIWYLIPLWNYWILAKESEMKVMTFFLPLFLLITIEFLTIDVKSGLFILFIIKLILSAIFSFKFVGSVARKLGKEYKAYGVLSLIFTIYFPLLMLAFESIDKFFTSSNMYTLSQEEKESLSISGEAMDMRGKKINYGIVYFLIFMILVSYV